MHLNEETAWQPIGSHIGYFCLAYLWHGYQPVTSGNFKKRRKKSVPPQNVQIIRRIPKLFVPFSCILNLVARYSSYSWRGTYEWPSYCNDAARDGRD